MKIYKIYFCFALLFICFVFRAIAAGPYTDNGNTVTDHSTGLMWQKADDGQTRTWKEALSYCEALALAEHNDWRLPDLMELSSIADRSRYNPALDPVFEYSGPWYWSSSTYAGNTADAWGVYFTSGYTNNDGKSNSNYVRCVSARPSGSFDPSTPLIISFSADQLSGLAPHTVVFSCVVESGNPPYYYDYYFGDGQTSSGQQNGSYTYPAGTYTAKIVVTDAKGQIAEKTLTITVDEQYVNQPPTASINTSVTEGDAPLSVNFTGLGSDPEGQVLSYSWNFGDGSTAEGVSVSHTFNQAGDYTVGLTVTDPEGASASAQVVVKAKQPYVNQPPTVSINADVTEGDAPLTVNFTGVGSDPEGQALSYSWNFGDGSTAEGASVSHTFNHAVDYTVGLTVTDPEGASASAQVVIKVKDSVVVEPSGNIGRAVVIAAGGAQVQNTLFPFTEGLTNDMYKLLSQRGFLDGDIFYMNPKDWQDIDGDGQNDNVVDYTLFDPANELEQAFNNAVQGLAQGSQFVCYIHGHARADNITVTREYELPAANLKALLDKVPSGIQQIVVIDTCYSGSFLDELAGNPDRIVITSSDDHTLAWNVEYTNFSSKFIRSLKRGKNLLEAFEAAEDMIVGDPDLFGPQRPQLDDNQDGKYSTVDGTRAAQIVIGKPGVHAANPPSIILVHPVLELPLEQATGTIWVKTSPGNEGIKRVRAVLIKPGFQPKEYQGEETQFGREEIDLIYNASQQRFEINYNNFRESGTWRIMYQAQGIDGEWSDVAFGEVKAAGVSTPVTVTVGANQSSYQTNDQLRLDVTVNGNQMIDLYVAIVFPAGFFQTIQYPFNLSFVNSIMPYKTGIEIAGEQIFPILDIALPPGLPLGSYYYFGIVMIAGSDPWNGENWINFDFKIFEIK